MQLNLVEENECAFRGKIDSLVFAETCNDGIRVVAWDAEYSFDSCHVRLEIELDECVARKFCAGVLDGEGFARAPCPADKERVRVARSVPGFNDTGEFSLHRLNGAHEAPSVASGYYMLIMQSLY